MAVLEGCLLNLDPLELNLQILLFDEIMALLEATWEEANVLKLFFVEDFNNATEHFVVEVTDVHLIFVLDLHRALTKEIARFIIIFRGLLVVKAQQTNVCMIFAVIN